MTSCLPKLKVTPSFCFAFKIPDDPTATSINNKHLSTKVLCFIFQEAWTNQEQLFSKITSSNKRDIEHLLNFLNFEIKYILRPRSAPSMTKLVYNGYIRLSKPLLCAYVSLIIQFPVWYLK